MNIRVIRTLQAISEQEQIPFVQSILTQWWKRRWLTPKQWSAATNVCANRGYDVDYVPGLMEITDALGAPRRVPEGWPVIEAAMRAYRWGTDLPVLNIALPDGSVVQCMLNMHVEKLPKWKGAKREWNRTQEVNLVHIGSEIKLLGTIDHTGAYEPVSKGTFPRVGDIRIVRDVIQHVVSDAYAVQGDLWKKSQY